MNKWGGGGVRNDTCWRWGEEGHVGGGVRRDMWEVGVRRDCGKWGEEGHMGVGSGVGHMGAGSGVEHMGWGQERYMLEVG